MILQVCLLAYVHGEEQLVVGEEGNSVSLGGYSTVIQSLERLLAGNKLCHQVKPVFYQLW